MTRACFFVVLAAGAACVACHREPYPGVLGGFVYREAGQEIVPDAARIEDSRAVDAGACGDPAKGDKVIPYAGTSNFVSTSFSLTVNCQPVFVEQFGNLSYAHFAFAGTAQVTITLSDTVNAPESYMLSPKSFGVQPAHRGYVHTFELTVPHKLLFWNVITGVNLAILADSLEDTSYAPGQPGVTDIASYGVASDGSEVVTAAIQTALDDVAAAPAGGILYFGPGTYATGSLRIGNFTTIYLAAGATLHGTGEISDYPPDLDINDGVAGLESVGPQTYQLEFDDAVSSKLIGRGTVDMNGTELRIEGASGGRLLQIKNSTNIEVRDVILRDPASWNVQVLNSNQVSFSNVKVINNNTITNTDGIDPDSAQGVVIDDTFIYSGDDAIAVKSSGSYLGIVANPSDIVVRNSTVFTLEAALKLGTESLAKTTEGVTFENDDVITADRAIAVYARDGTDYESTAWRAIRVESIAVPGVFYVPYPYNINPSPQLMTAQVLQRYATSALGRIDGMTFEALQAKDTGSNPSTFVGLDDNNEISGVSFIDTTLASGPVGSLTDLGATVNAYVTPPTFSFTPYGLGDPTIYVTATTLYATREKPGVFTIGRLGNLGQELEVDFIILGSAVNGSDYAPIPSQAVLPAGAGSAVVTITPLDAGTGDAASNSVKTVRLSLLNSPTWQYLLGPDYQAVVTLSP
jgi:hypothetical protein